MFLKNAACFKSCSCFTNQFWFVTFGKFHLQVTLDEELEAEAVQLDQGQAESQDQVEVPDKKGKKSKGAR